MRISNLIRSLENVVIAGMSRVAHATAQLSRDVDAERRARNMVSAARRAKLEEYRAIVEAQDKLAIRRAKYAERKASK